MESDILKHKISQQKKLANDSEWGRKIMDYIAPAYLGSSSRWERNKMHVSNYKLYNNEIEHEDFDKWCKPYGIDVGQYDEEVMPFNKIPNKVNVLLGEEIIRDDEYTPMLLSQKDIIEKTEQLRNNTRQYVQSEIAKILEQVKMYTENISQEEYQQMVQEYNNQYMPDELDHKKFLTQKEMFAAKVLKYARYDQGLKNKKNLAFKHAIISDTECMYVGIDRGKPVITVVNPLNLFFQKGPEIEYIQDGDFAGQRMMMTRFDCLNTYGDDMKASDREKFERAFYVRQGTAISPNIDPHTQFENSLDYRTPFAIASAERIDNGEYGQHASDGSFSTTLDLVEVVHVEWKTQRRVYFLTTYNQYGEANVEIVDEQYPIPEEATRVKKVNKFGTVTTVYEWVNELTQTPVLAQELWIPRIWEGTRIEGDIFVNVREKPNQPMSIDDPYRCAKLGYIGKVFTNTNAKSISLMSRMRPFQILYFIAMHQLSKLLSQNQGKQLVLDQAQQPEFDDPFGRDNTEMQLFYQSKGLIFTNSMSNSQGGSMPANRGQAVNAIDMSTTQDMLNLTMLCNWLDEQIGFAAGISREREGQIQKYTNASDNQQAIAQSSYITELYFNQHAELWGHVMYQYLNTFIIWARNWFEMNPTQTEMMLQYLLDDSSIEILKISPKELTEAEFGIVVALSSATQEYKTKMEQYIMPLIQNQMQGAEIVSQILKSRRDGTSPEKIHEMIKTMVSQQQEKEAQIQQQQAEQQERMLKMQEEAKATEHERELEKIAFEEELKKEREIAVNTIKTFSWNPDKDMNQNQIPDVIEVANLQLKKDFEANKLAMDKEKLDLQKKMHEDKIELEKKKIKQQNNKQ